MKPRTFEVTLISGSIRIVRRIAAHSAVAATRIALSCMPSTSAPLAVICKPVPAFSLTTEEPQPCAA